MLDTMLSVLKDKYENVESKFKPFFDVLDPRNVNESPTPQLKTLGDLYPKEIPDTLALSAELEVFWDFLKNKEEGIELKEVSTRSAADFAIKCNIQMGLFPPVAKLFRLLLTAPPSVCKSGRSFSKLKILKIYLRGKLNQERLDHLMILSCEKDVADIINLHKVAKAWTKTRTRRIDIGLD